MVTPETNSPSPPEFELHHSDLEFMVGFNDQLISMHQYQMPPDDRRMYISSTFDQYSSFLNSKERNGESVEGLSLLFHAETMMATTDQYLVGACGDVLAKSDLLDDQERADINFLANSFHEDRARGVPAHITADSLFTYVMPRSTINERPAYKTILWAMVAGATLEMTELGAQQRLRQTMQEQIIPAV